MSGADAGAVRFAGYAALFGVADRAGDVFRAGAFGPPRTVPLLWQHRGAPVGAAAVMEDARGLRVIGTVAGPAAGLVRSGAAGGDARSLAGGGDRTGWMRGEAGMDDWTTTRLRLPLLATGQAAKETTHNEALALLDLAVGCVVEGTEALPPADPAPGRCWIVAAGAGGEWAGRDGAVAGWTPGGWRYLPATEGLEVLSGAARTTLRCDGTGWAPAAPDLAGLWIGGRRVVGPRRPAIAGPDGGATVDVEARAAVAQILSALTAHGLIGAVD